MKIIICSLFLSIATSLTHAVDSLEVLNKSGGDFSFDPKIDYLDVNLVELTPENPGGPSFWDRVFGKKTKFGLIYAEFKQQEKMKKIPLFTYSAKSDDNYEIDNIAVSSGVIFPLLERTPYDLDNAPKIKLVARYWEEEKKTDLIKELISAANLLGSMDTGKLDDALSISTTLVSLIEQLWPSTNQTSSTTLALVKSNTDKKKISFGYQGKKIITIGLDKKSGYFVNNSFNSALDEYRPEQYNVWRGAIVQIDQNLSQTGIQALINRLEAYSAYISTLPLNYADKVLIQAHSIQEWAPNAVNGELTDNNGNKIHLSYAQYRRLDNSDWALLGRLTDNVLTTLNGAQNCKSSQCKAMADYLSKSSVELDVSNYLPPKITINENGNIINYSPEEFIKNFKINNDPGWDSFSPARGSSTKWVASFNKGTLAFSFNGLDYKKASIKITLIETSSDSSIKYYIQSIKISEST